MSKPAILGGQPIFEPGPPDWPMADADVLAGLQAAYQNKSWGKYEGGNASAVESALLDYFGVAHVLLCGSGTFAVELALRALRIDAGDEVILSAYDYPGNFLAVHAVGAHPVLVDPAPHNWNFDPLAIENAISSATKAVIVSHLHGGLVPMLELMDIARVHHLHVIEDAAQCPGARVQGRLAGAWGDVGVLSFGGSKLLTAGRGGALLTQQAGVAQRARTLFFRGNQVCPLSELQAAVLLPQLAKLDERNEVRRRNVAALCDKLVAIPGMQPLTPIPSPLGGEGEGVRGEGSFAAYYKLGFRFDAAAFGLPRRAFVCAVRAEGVAMDEGFHAQHVGRSPRRFRQVGTLANADAAHHGCVILHHPVLLGSDSDMERVAAAIQKIRDHAADIADPDTA